MSKARTHSRALPFVAGIALLLASFAGCAASGNDGSGSGNPATSSLAQSITQDGVYTIEGNIDGQVLVTAKNVTLVLDSAKIANADGPAILGYFEGGKQKLIVELKGDSQVSSSSSHAIQAKDELTVTGDGSIVLTAEKDGLHAGNALSLEGGTISIFAKGDGIQCGDSDDASGEMALKGGLVNISSTKKGIKCGGPILASGGTYVISSTDDSVHSNGEIEIAGGDFTISTGDDGIHADKAVTIGGGTIRINKSYEGIEGSTITIGGGDITVFSSDDGINAVGDKSASGSVNPTMFTRNQPNRASGATISVSGGSIVLYTTSDGIDVNGTLEISGGLLAIFVGTTRDGDPTDTDAGGTITPALYGKNNIASGTTLAVGDIWSLKLESNTTSYCIVIPGLVNGQSYTLTANGTRLLDITATTTIQGMMFGKGGKNR